MTSAAITNTVAWKFWGGRSVARAARKQTERTAARAHSLLEGQEEHVRRLLCHSR